MILELHVIQNVAPSNLNRSDNGSPKDAVFGGYRRSRVSSQSWKRAIRKAFSQRELIPADHIAVRTKRLIRSLSTGLADRGYESSESLKVAETLLAGLALERDKDTSDEQPDTEYLILLSEAEIRDLVELAASNWDDLLRLGSQKTKLTKKTGPKAVPAEIRSRGASILDGGKAADTALFGRMLADLPSANVEGSAQVAHAISTHAVEMEFDFYTAVDDLKERERLDNPEKGVDAGAEMMGTVEFNSATFYRYTNVDIAQLMENLGNDIEIAEATIRAYADAFLTSMPSGKQHSFAAQNPPSFALAVVRDAGRWSLTNAFVNPVQKGRGDLVEQSIKALESYWERITEQYGDDDIVALPIFVDREYNFDIKNGASFPSLIRWIDAILGAIEFNEG